MKRIKSVVVCILPLAMMPSCGDESQPACDTHADCQQTEACIEGKCVEVDPLEILTELLPWAVAGVAYDATLEARGGVGEKRWTLEYAPDWVAIHPSSGALTGTPQEADPAGTAIRMMVKDEQGSQDRRDLLLVVMACLPGNKYPCHGEQDGACFFGEHTCGSDGKPGPCAFSTPSQDASVCGPGCGACDPVLAPDCVDGVCQCGRAAEGVECDDGEVCCDGQCVDLQTDRDHCGSCDRPCDDPVEWYQTGACEQGTCEWVSCPEGWANCDTKVLGCETQLGTIDNCGQCGHECPSGCADGVCFQWDPTISAGHYHTCVVLNDGSAWCWGSNGSGRLGDGTENESATPVQVKTSDGSSELSNVASISAGGAHTCAMLNDGSAWCWGRNASGQLGDGTGNDSATPVQVKTSDGSGELSNVASISAGGDHTCAMLNDGSAWCWGRNASGQLGDGTTHQSCGEAFIYDCSFFPVQVKTSDGSSELSNVASISAGDLHTCAVLNDGSAWCWGRDASGQLGEGTSISVGVYHICGVLNDGSAWCWGHNSDGQLGDGTTNESSTPVKVKTSDGSGELSNVASISAAYRHTCAMQNDGSVWCWGFNHSGSLGDGTENDSATPVQVKNSDGSGKLSNVASISAGEFHTCAMLNDASAWCWGDNRAGQLGDGTSDNTSSTPVQVLNLP